MRRLIKREEEEYRNMFGEELFQTCYSQDVIPIAFFAQQGHEYTCSKKVNLTVNEVIE